MLRMPTAYACIVVSFTNISFHSPEHLIDFSQRICLYSKNTTSNASADQCCFWWLLVGKQINQKNISQMAIYYGRSRNKSPTKQTRVPDVICNPTFSNSNRVCFLPIFEEVTWCFLSCPCYQASEALPGWSCTIRHIWNFIKIDPAKTMGAFTGLDTISLISNVSPFQHRKLIWNIARSSNEPCSGIQRFEWLCIPCLLFDPLSHIFQWCPNRHPVTRHTR